MLTENTVMEFPSDLPTTPTQLVGKQETLQFFSGFGGFLTHDEIRLVAVHQTTNPNLAILAKGAIAFLPLWLLGSGVNMYLGVKNAGYTVGGVAGGRRCIRRTSAYRPGPLGETALKRLMRL
jgi:hypothetical protein